MSERERWIVYPLLFLALGAGLRDKLIKQTTSDKVICKDLYCERVFGDEVYLRNSPQQYARVLHENRLMIPHIESTQILQQGRPVAVYSPQLLRALNLWGGMPPLRAAPAQVGSPPESTTPPAAGSP